ncbi:hypothetical protein [Candidatus Synchoanobacter obligatus]|uniref:Uncharacterized protein n=1 Tax=Candidatus Synchoanobacter obligatus TaxID=2919597 RepID=A0ABT1L3S9_9GAMM|nr:hypothetical protein [Candidatus Synchoanobacter obligatus]MCP8351849.1 hypothetical protein [Candidatus Synchoanobacter obligatus]
MDNENLKPITYLSSPRSAIYFSSVQTAAQKTALDTLVQVAAQERAALQATNGNN